MALLVDSAYEFSPTNIFLQLYVVAQGSFIKERQDPNNNYCHMCGAHSTLAMAMKPVDASVCVFTSYLVVVQALLDAALSLAKHGWSACRNSCDHP